MTSVNTNYGALVALQSLNATTRELDEVQGRINTGLKVTSAKDNGAVFAIAEGQRARVASLGAVTDGIDRATSVIDVGLSAGEAIGDILKQLKEKSVAAQAEDLSSDQRDALQADFDALVSQIDQIANAATFNGSNLVNGSNLTNFTVLTSDASGGGGGGAIQLTTTASTAAMANGNQVVSTYDPDGNGALADGDVITFTTDPGDANEAVFNFEVDGTETIDQMLTRIGTETGGIIRASLSATTGEITFSSARDFDVDASATSGGADVLAWLGDGQSGAAPVGGGGGGSNSVTVTGYDFRLSGSGPLAALTGLDISTNSTTASAASTAIDTALVALNSNLATLGAQAKALDVQKTFLGKLSDSIEAGIGNLVDADLAKESARLQSLQVKQQLGAQALSIANSAPSIVLSFFR
jgi:flagellin